MSSKAVIALVLLVMAIGFTAGMVVDPAQLGPLAGLVGQGPARSGPSKPAATGAIAYTIDTTAAAAAPARFSAGRPLPLFQPGDSAGCVLPSVDSQALFVLFRAYEGAAISSVALDGMERKTSVADVEIQPGNQPLYLMMASYGPMIWRFKGATDRIAQLVLLSDAKSLAGKAVVGETGVDDAKLTVDRRRDCLPADGGGAAASGMAAEALQRRIGRRPDVQGYLNKVDRLQLPSARAAALPADSFDRPPGFDRQEWDAALRFMPAGLVQVDAAQVRSPVDAQPYDILPSEMGLAQLLGSGALTHDGDRFKIVKPVAHFPAELAGAHAVTFILASGAPLPGGDPGHSCVLGEGGGALASRGLCR